MKQGIPDIVTYRGRLDLPPDRATDDPVARSGLLTGQTGGRIAMPFAFPLAPIILAGGAGTRLWPLSREQYPKQLIDLLGDDTLLQATVRRAQALTAIRAATDPIVVCGADQRFATAAQMRECGIDASFIVEPMRRNTAPALTLAAAMLAAQSEDAILVAMPADHAIVDLHAFARSLAIATNHAQRGAVVALGVPPARPDTAFGYMRVGASVGDGAFAIDRFVEKPTAEFALEYVESGAYWWNCGIFVVLATVWLDMLQALQPRMYDACMAAVESGTREGVFFHPDGERFAKAPSDSIDFAVMEHLAGDEALAPTVAVPLDAGWSDLGSWDAVWEALDKDADGNVSKGRVFFEGAKSSFAHAQGRLVACVGVTNVVVVETDDAVLVADRAHVQDVKALVERIKAQAAPEADHHRKVQRPWGYYDSLDHGERFQVKRIVIDPGCRLSLQRHHHRAEHWIVVRGTALVTRATEQFLVSENESTFIPVGVIHRVENPGKFQLEIIEVQSGAYLGEDDIVRFDDSYGRA
ncbi:mannose-1-phosphate guanylyltransferase/mannose-6-phosphate isomerase [Trinickia symbiotica]|nr:mannose-1-phosphate guanylyltransferase/mannose-6-phosphate isomerase [Trinickia symbiotica]